MNLCPAYFLYPALSFLVSVAAMDATRPLKLIPSHTIDAMSAPPSPIPWLTGAFVTYKPPPLGFQAATCGLEQCIPTDFTAYDLPLEKHMKLVNPKMRLRVRGKRDTASSHRSLKRTMAGNRTPGRTCRGFIDPGIMTNSLHGELRPFHGSETLPCRDYRDPSPRQ